MYIHFIQRQRLHSAFWILCFLILVDEMHVQVLIFHSRCCKRDYVASPGAWESIFVLIPMECGSQNSDFHLK